MIVFALALEFDRLSSFFVDFINDKFGGIQMTSTKLGLFLIFGFILAGGLATLWWFRERIKRKPLYYKLRSFIREMINGFTSVLRLERRRGFWLSTIFIWVLYYVMAYVLFFSQRIQCLLSN